MQPADDQALRAYLNASANLLQSVLADARMADAEAVAGLSRMLGAGGMLTLRSTFAPSTGLALASVHVVEPSGEEHQLMRCELQRLTAQ